MLLRLLEEHDVVRSRSGAPGRRTKSTEPFQSVKRAMRAVSRAKAGEEERARAPPPRARERRVARREPHQGEGGEAQQEGQDHGHEAAQGEEVVVPDADLVEVEAREGGERASTGKR